MCCNYVEVLAELKEKPQALKKNGLYLLNENCISASAFAVLDASMTMHSILTDMSTGISTDTRDSLMLPHSYTVSILRSFCLCPLRLPQPV